MKKPLVSIVIPSYKPEFFELALKSALGQSYTNIEILVSDNCPSEDIHQICDKYPQVFYFRNQAVGVENVFGSLFSGKGEFVKPLLDDDILHPNCVQRMVEVATSRLEEPASFIFSASYIIDNNNNNRQLRRPFEHPFVKIDGRTLQRKMVLTFENFVGELTTILINRAALDNFELANIFCYGGKNYAYGLSDVALFCNLATIGPILYVDDVLSYFRRDPELMSNSNPSANKNFINCIVHWFDMLISSHAQGIISSEELQGMREKVFRWISYWKPVYPQIEEYATTYEEYLEGVLQR